MNREVLINETIKQDLSLWAEKELAARQWSINSPLTLKSLTGDAGFRRYFRISSEPSLLAVFAPPSVEKNESFVALAAHFVRHGVHAPNIVAVDLQRGFLLLEDFGDTLFQSVLTEDAVDVHYGEALLTLLRLQQCPVNNIGNESLSIELPAYDAQMLLDEMSLFHEWFVPQLLGYELQGNHLEMLSKTYNFLVDAAVSQPQVFVHRDFHSRNLIYQEGQAPGVIDFQDAVKGPITYDLVSLLRDCYVRWPKERVERWALAYGAMAVDVGLVPEVNQQQWMGWFDLMGLQRHIKVLGIFARLHLRDNKPNYLKDLPLVIRYTLETAKQYPELDEFVQWFTNDLLPLCERQDWYIDFTQAGN